MKIRSIALGVSLGVSDFLNKTKLASIFESASNDLKGIEAKLQEKGYEVQTLRISLNSFEEWLIPLLKDPYSLSYSTVINNLVEELEKANINFCSIGCCQQLESIRLLPEILAISDRISASVLFQKTNEGNLAPSLEKCQVTAESCLKVVEKCGDLGNFRFCASFNCKSGIPFFPAAYHEGKNAGVSIGLESGDLLFLAFHGAKTADEGRDNLIDIFHQVLEPIQLKVKTYCEANQLNYNGIDCSINPGLTLPDSVGAGLENLLFPRPQLFGSMGTLATVSAVTSAIKHLEAESVKEYGENGFNNYLLIPGKPVLNPPIKLIGYNGLMLPVMEDLILAKRAYDSENSIPIPDKDSKVLSPPMYGLRDLLLYSSICGVGLDTCPIPGGTTKDELAAVYMEVGSLAFRLNKPLSCRVLPIPGKKAGDVAHLDSPYLCDTRVFSIP